MNPSTPLLPSALAGGLIESLLYGAFLILSTTSLWLLWDQNRISPGRLPTKPSYARGIPLITASCLLLIGVTAHWIASVLSLFQAFVTYKSGTAPAEYYATYLDNPVPITSIIVIFLCILTYDVISIYRVWGIWSFRWRIVFIPACFLIAFIASSIGGAYATLHHLNPFEEPHRTPWWKWDTAALSSSLCINLYCTLSICARILIAKIDLFRAGLKVSSAQFIQESALMLLESGFIYTIWAIFHFTCYEVSYEVSDAISFVTEACSPAVAGITFASIIVQSRLTWPRAAGGLDELQFAVPPSRKSNVYSIGIDITDVAQCIEGADDAGMPVNVTLSEVSSEKPDSPFQADVL